MESGVRKSNVVIAYDATKERGVEEVKVTIDGLRVRGDILRPLHTLLVLGVLHKLPNPMGYQINACPDSFVGASIRAMEEEVTKKVDMYVNMLLQSAEVCENEGVSIEVKITAGTPMRQVIVQEVLACNPTWVILDRHLRKDLRFYVKQLPCKIALIQDNMSLLVEKPHSTNEADVMEHKLFYSMSKAVPALSPQSGEHNGQSVIDFRSYSLSSSIFESSDLLRGNLSTSSSHKSRVNSASGFGVLAWQDKSEAKYSVTGQLIHNHHNYFHSRSLKAPILCSVCGARTELYIKDSMRFSFSEIQLATDDFSKDNLLGEGGYGHVYKGKLKDGQQIAAKVHKEESAQGFEEFHSEIYVLNFARHKNIVMLLGYCCKENLNILVYEYICNKSLEWHLFDKTANNLEWHQRHAIAIGTAKGLRFLHEECRGGPIIHRDVRPSNILLTHDFVPMLGDFGLARWKTGDDTVYTRVLGTLGYLAPEYAENGAVSVRTDVYAYGIVLLQLISGRKVLDEKRPEGQQSLRQWAEPLIQRCALHELLDPRLGESYDMYELYNMAKAAALCVQRSPEMRPSIGEVLRLIEGENDNVYHLREQMGLHYSR